MTQSRRRVLGILIALAVLAGVGIVASAVRNDHKPDSWAIMACVRDEGFSPNLIHNNDLPAGGGPDDGLLNAAFGVEGPHPQDTIYIADRNNTVLAIVDRPTKGKGETTISYTKARSSQRAKDRIMSCVIR
jgi:hypothetical protein